MDGNGRWAERQGHPRLYGHIKGARVAKKIITECVKKNVEYLTLYAFSTENWLRPEEEVTFLFNLLKRYLQKEVQTLIQQNIRFSVIGQVERLPKEVRAIVYETIQATANCTGMNLVFALSYGSKNEIAQTAKLLAQKVALGELNPDSINEELFSNCLSTYPAPDVDIIIRTSGEKRLSNFMLWQAAYAELFFSETLWPDFTANELNTIIECFEARERRFGKIIQHQTSPSLNEKFFN